MTSDVVLAGAFAGIIMAMIFLPHVAIVLVFRSDGLTRPPEEASSAYAWMLVALAGATFLTWTALGIGAALIFSAAQRTVPTHVPGIPSALYLVGVAAVVALASPWVFVLAPRLWRHAAFEAVIFLAIFGVQIPMTAGAG